MLRVCLDLYLGTFSLPIIWDRELSPYDSVAYHNNRVKQIDNKGWEYFI